MSNVVAIGHISASTAEDYLRCERLYYFKQVLGLTDETSVAQSFGTVLDYAFDAYYSTRSVAAMQAEVEARWPGDVTEETSEKGRTKERALRICELYAEKWRHDGIEVVVPAMRENQYVDIPGTRYRLAFKLDKIVRWDRTLRIMEHKTTSQLTANTLNRYDPSVQNKFYTWAARRLPLPVPGVIAGVLMDITCVNTQKLDFKRDTVSSSLEQDHETEALLQEIVMEIEQKTSANSFRPNWTACSMYGECAFRRVCKMSPEYRSSILGTYARRAT